MPTETKIPFAYQPELIDRLLVLETGGVHKIATHNFIRIVDGELYQGASKKLLKAIKPGSVSDLLVPSGVISLTHYIASRIAFDNLLIAAWLAKKASQLTIFGHMNWVAILRPTNKKSCPYWIIVHEDEIEALQTLTKMLPGNYIGEKEARVIINGKLLTHAQTMCLYGAVNTLQLNLQHDSNTCTEGDKPIVQHYLTHLTDINKLMGLS